jgi:hypothetical protein
MIKYTIGDIFQWNYKPESNTISTIIDITVDITVDKTGKEKYILQSHMDIQNLPFIRETYTREEIEKFIRNKILIHYPVVQ